MSKSRKIVVTGASSGIGKAATRHLLKCGSTVIGIARRMPESDHPNLLSYAVDLSATSAEKVLIDVAKTHADIDAVISIAGAGQFGSLENFSWQQIKQSIAQNLLSHMLVARCFINVLKKQTSGNLIFMGSETALSGARQGSIYSAAKFGLRGFTQSLRAECATSGLHVGIINPGLVRTPFFDSLDFTPGDHPENALDVEDVVDAISLMLNARGNAVVDEINLSPLKNVVNKRPAKD